MERLRKAKLANGLEIMVNDDWKVGDFYPISEIYGFTQSYPFGAQELSNRLMGVCIVSIDCGNAPAVSGVTTVLGQNIVKGDVIKVDDEWVTVVNAWNHPRSCYNKLNIDTSVYKGLYHKIGKKDVVLRKLPEVVMQENKSVALLELDQLMSAIQDKYKQYRAINDIPGERIEVFNSGISATVDKSAVLTITRNDLKALVNKQKNLVDKL